MSTATVRHCPTGETDMTAQSSNPRPLPPRQVIEILCARAHDGHWLAASISLPGIVAHGHSAPDAATRIRRLAQEVAGEPVRVVVEVLHDEHAEREAAASTTPEVNHARP